MFDKDDKQMRNNIISPPQPPPPPPTLIPNNKNIIEKVKNEGEVDDEGEVLNSSYGEMGLNNEEENRLLCENIIEDHTVTLTTVNTPLEKQKKSLSFIPLASDTSLKGRYIFIC